MMGVHVSYDALNAEEKATKPLEGIYTPDDIIGISNDAYQSRFYCTSPVKKPLCAAGETLFGNVTQEQCLTAARPVTPYCELGELDALNENCYVDALATTTTTTSEDVPPVTTSETTYSCPDGGDLEDKLCRTEVSFKDRCDAGKALEEIMINGELVERCTSAPKSHTPNDWSCTGGNSFGGSCSITRETYLDENDQLIVTVDEDGYAVQPRDNEGTLINFEDSATCSITHTPGGETETPKSFCVFDKYEVMDQGAGDQHPTVLDMIPPFFDGDTGNKTWKVNLAGYKCNPTYDDISVIDPDTGELISYTWEEIQEMPNQCQAYIDDPNCNEIARKCTDGWYEGESERCMADTVTYECKTPKDLQFERKTTTNVCDSAIPCAGGNCELGENESNNRFVEAMVQGSVLQGVDGDRSCDVPDDPTTCRIFEGEAEYCSWEVTGLGSDCCEEPAGLNILAYISMAQGLQRMNAMSAQGAFGSTLQGYSSSIVDGANGAWTTVKSGVEAGWNALSEPLTSATESLFGTTAGATTDAIASGGADAAAQVGEGFISEAISQVQQQAMKMVYDALPEDLASMIMEEGVTQAGTEKVSGYALNETLSSVINFIGGAYMAYQMIKLALTLLTACDENEMDMGTKLGQRQCFKVDEPYCSSELLGVCYQKRQDYCCYSSILARIIMEQAGGLLNKDMSNCAGLSQAELGELDFNQIDLSEWVGLLMESGEIPTETTEQSLTGGGEMVGTQCETTEITDPETGVVTTKEDCYGRMEGGRLLNAQNRQTVSDRTKERMEGTSEYSKDAADAAVNTANDLDCSVLPRPPVCSFGFDPRDE